MRTIDQFKEECESNSREELDNCIIQIHRFCEILGDNPHILGWRRSVLNAITIMFDLVDDTWHDQLSHTIEETTRDVQYMLDDAANLCDGKMLIEAAGVLRVELRRMSINFNVPAKNSNRYIWVAQWVADAIKFYNDNNGYAGLSRLKYLGKMRPKPETDTPDAPVPGETLFDWELHKRRPANKMISENDEDHYNIQKRVRHKVPLLKKKMGKNGPH